MTSERQAGLYPESVHDELISEHIVRRRKITSARLVHAKHFALVHRGMQLHGEQRGLR